MVIIAQSIVVSIESALDETKRLIKIERKFEESFVSGIFAIEMGNAKSLNEIRC